MGSLMGGWDAPVHDPRTESIQRNMSLTKQDIEAFWRSKKKDEEEHLKAISEMLTKSNEESMPKEPADQRKIQKSRSVPSSSAKDRLDMGTETTLENVAKKHGWWTRCTSAFLNEPPVIASDGSPAYKYLSQLHVAGIATPE